MTLQATWMGQMSVAEIDAAKAELSTWEDTGTPEPPYWPPEYFEQIEANSKAMDARWRSVGPYIVERLDKAIPGTWNHTDRGQASGYLQGFRRVWVKVTGWRVDQPTNWHAWIFGANEALQSHEEITHIQGRSVTFDTFLEDIKWAVCQVPKDFRLDG